MRGWPKPTLPDWLTVGTRLVHVCKCKVPTPGEYVVVRIGASRKIAWAEHDNGGGSAVLRSRDFIDWGERYERAEPKPARRPHGR